MPSLIDITVNLLLSGVILVLSKFLWNYLRSPLKSYLLSNVLAGSDTTAISLCAAMYYVLKHLEVHRKLRDEIHRAQLPIPARWKDIQDLPYLNAVMRKAMRILSGVGLMLERIVPEGGP